MIDVPAVFAARTSKAPSGRLVNVTVRDERLTLSASVIVASVSANSFGPASSVQVVEKPVPPPLASRSMAGGLEARIERANSDVSGTTLVAVAEIR